MSSRGAEEMYALDLLDLGTGKGNKSGFVSKEERGNLQEREDWVPESDSSFRDFAVKKNVIKPFGSQKLDFKLLIPIVAKYLAQKAKTKEYIAGIMGRAE